MTNDLSNKYQMDSYIDQYHKFKKIMCICVCLSYIICNHVAIRMLLMFSCSKKVLHNKWFALGNNFSVLQLFIALQVCTHGFRLFRKLLCHKVSEQHSMKFKELKLLE